MPTHWSTREMAKASGLSDTTVLRIWHAFGLQPHRAETFKLSASCLNNLAGVLHDQGELDRARLLYDSAGRL
jgi:hypothetical protein